VFKVQVAWLDFSREGRSLLDRLLKLWNFRDCYYRGCGNVTFDWIYALIGFLIMFGYLVGIGINKPRGMSMKTWCYGYFGVSCWGSLPALRRVWRFMLLITSRKKTSMNTVTKPRERSSHPCLAFKKAGSRQIGN
jgi:hypothetical protein